MRTIARNAGAAVGDFHRLANTPLRRREAVLWAAGLLLLNNLAAYLLYPHAEMGWAWLFQSGFGAFDAVAWAVALWRLGQAPDGVISRSDTIVLVAICLLGSLPAREAAPIALTALALWIAVKGEVQTRAAAVILAAIASHQIWGKALFALFYSELVKLDAAMVGTAVSLGIPGASWHDNIVQVPGGNGIAVFEGCASCTNVSAAILAWVAFTKLERPGWVRSDLWVLAAIVFGQVFLNVTRMYLMALSPDLYAYWHNGIGKEIYAVAASALAVVVSILGARWAESRS